MPSLMASFRSAMAAEAYMAADPAIWPTAGNTKDWRGRTLVPSPAARPVAPLGASAAPRKADSAVDTSETAITLSLDISCLLGEKESGM